MSEPHFRCDDQGNLWWTDLWRDRDDIERLAQFFESEHEYASKRLASECRQALADYDRYHQGSAA